MSDRREIPTLETRLVALGVAIEWPETRDLSSLVRGRLEEGQRPRATRPFPVPRIAFGVAMAIVAAIAVTLTLFPGARQAVADWLGISGIEIRVRENAPTPSTRVDSIEDLELGAEVLLSESQDTVDFDLKIPDETEFGKPRVYLRRAPVAAVSFVYPPGPSVPRSRHTGVGMLLTQFRGRYDPNLVKKVSATSTLEPVAVGDGGYWLEGRPHSVLFLDEDGRVREDQVRLAGNTLIWEQNGVSYRLEADLERQEALEIAESLE